MLRILQVRPFLEQFGAVQCFSYLFTVSKQLKKKDQRHQQCCEIGCNFDSNLLQCKPFLQQFRAVWFISYLFTVSKQLRKPKTFSNFRESATTVIVTCGRLRLHFTKRIVCILNIRAQVKRF